MSLASSPSISYLLQSPFEATSFFTLCCPFSTCSALRCLPPQAKELELETLRQKWFVGCSSIVMCVTVLSHTGHIEVTSLCCILGGIRYIQSCVALKGDGLFKGLDWVRARPAFEFCGVLHAGKTFDMC